MVLSQPPICILKISKFVVYKIVIHRNRNEDNQATTRKVLKLHKDFRLNFRPTNRFENEAN
jgi:hypothetical protein